MITEWTHAQKVCSVAMKISFEKEHFQTALRTPRLKIFRQLKIYQRFLWRGNIPTFSNRGSLYRSNSDPGSAVDSLVAAITGNTTDDMLWALLKGISNHFAMDLCSEVGIGVHLTKAAIMMMDLGDIKSAERLLRLVQRRHQDKHLCFCNSILGQYVEEGARDLCGKSLRKLSALSVFQPARARIAAHSLLCLSCMERLMDVLRNLQMVRFIEIVDASPICAMNSLAGLPKSVKVVSARSHLVGATGRTGLAACAP